MEISKSSVMILTDLSQHLGWDQSVFEQFVNNISDVDELSLVFVNRPVMAHYNQSYRGKNLATDILTFCEEKGSGEMILCPQMISVGAATHRIPEHVRLWHLIVHGLTHLQNLDHETARQLTRFQKYEKNLWEQLTLLRPSLKSWSWDKMYHYHYQYSVL